MQTVRRQWHRPTLLDFNEWFKEKAEGHERLKAINSKVKTEEPVKQKVRKNQNYLHVLYVKVNTVFGIRRYSKRKTLRNERNM